MVSFNSNFVGSIRLSMKLPLKLYIDGVSTTKTKYIIQGISDHYIFVSGTDNILHDLETSIIALKDYFTQLNCKLDICDIDRQIDQCNMRLVFTPAYSYIRIQIVNY